MIMTTPTDAWPQWTSVEDLLRGAGVAEGRLFRLKGAQWGIVNGSPQDGEGVLVSMLLLSANQACLAPAKLMKGENFQMNILLKKETKL